MKQFPVELVDLEVRLVGIEPPIWRRLDVPTHHSLDDLHEMIRILLGGPADPVYTFYVGERVFFPISSDWEPEEIGDAEDSTAVLLCDMALTPGLQFAYKDELGGWDVELRVVNRNRRRVEGPVCTAGARATPPPVIEDVWHYAELLEVLATPPRLVDPSEEVWEVSRNFDPERFHRHLANALLRRWAGRAI